MSIYKPEDLINEAMERSEEEFETLKEIVERAEGDELERQEGVEDEAKLIAWENMEIECWNLFRQVGR